MKIKLLLSSLIGIGASSCGPYLACEETKTGSFYMIYSEMDSVLMERHGNVQVEYSNIIVVRNLTLT